MKLPNAEGALVEEKKVVGYLLNRSHPEGAAKARFFEALGFSVDQWQTLAHALRRITEESPATASMVSSHGQKYIVDGTIETPADDHR